MSLEARYRSKDHAERYAAKHSVTRGHRIKDRSEQRMCGAALRAMGRPKRVLDCPSGTGRFWSTLAAHCSEVWACDSSFEMISVGRDQHRELALAGAAVVRAQELPFADGTFDAVFSSRLLHHLDDAAARIDVLRSYARVTKEWVAFTAWDSGSLKHRQIQLRGASRRPRNRHFIPVDEFRANARAAGLEPVRVIHKLRWVSPLFLMLCRRT